MILGNDQAEQLGLKGCCYGDNILWGSGRNPALLLSEQLSLGVGAKTRIEGQFPRVVRVERPSMDSSCEPEGTNVFHLLGCIWKEHLLCGGHRVQVQVSHPWK